MNQDQISATIRVGPAYLWLDRVTSIDPLEIVAEKDLPASLPIFQSHYAGFPLFPGALQCEACFQAASLLIAQSHPIVDGKAPVIGRVRNVKFKSMVRPEQTLRIEVAIQDRISKAYYLRGRVAVGDRTATTLDFVATETST